MLSAGHLAAHVRRIEEGFQQVCERLDTIIELLQAEEGSDEEE